MRRFVMFVFGVFTGVGVGIGTAILAAPMSGRQLIDEAQARLEALKEEARKASEARKAELEAELSETTGGAVSPTTS